MAYKSINTGFVARIVLLLAVIFGTGFSFVLRPEKELFFIPLMLLVVLILQVIEFVFYVKRISRSLQTILQTLKNTDHTTKFDLQAGSPLKELYHTFNEVTDYIRELKVEKEAQYGYLQTVIGHINIGIISLRDNNEIEFINEPALGFLGTSRPASWKDLSAMAPDFVKKTDEIQGKGSRLIEFKSGNNILRLSVKVSTLVILEEEFRIITFQDIRSELEQKEAEAWQKLIRVLRHEIMNSVTPISSMTETILMLVEDHLGASKKAADMTDEEIHDIRESLITIHDRSEGLHEFLEQYRELTRIPVAKKGWVTVSGLIDKSLRLLEADLSANDIRTTVIHGNPELQIYADSNLIEQVLINILRNSIEALAQTSEKGIDIRTEGNRHSQVITVTDNGCGITEKDLEEIFVPFYSTKEEGSGIGLSLSRQIMHLHGGDIYAASKSGKQTTLSLVFYE